MTSRDFCYWLQGYLELTQAEDPEDSVYTSISKDQVKVVANHLAMVFKHEIDPSMGDSKDRGVLRDIHDGLNKLPRGGGSGGSNTPMMC